MAWMHPERVVLIKWSRRLLQTRNICQILRKTANMQFITQQRLQPTSIILLNECRNWKYTLVWTKANQCPVSDCIQLAGDPMSNQTRDIIKWCVVINEMGDSSGVTRGIGARGQGKKFSIEADKISFSFSKILYDLFLVINCKINI